MTPQEAQQIIREASLALDRINTHDAPDTPDRATVLAAYEVLQKERQRIPQLRETAMIEAPRHGNGAPYLHRDAEIMDLHAQGLTRASIAARLGMDGATVSYRLRRAGIIPPGLSWEERRTIARERETLALRLQAEGKTCVAIARELGVSRQRGGQILAKAQRGRRRLLEKWRSCTGIDQEPTYP